MEQFDLLRHATQVVEELGLRYFVTGSTATIFYGEPRFTNDIDIVVELSDRQVAEFCERFPLDEFYLNESAVREAVQSKSLFNILHPVSGLKLDVIVPEASLFNQSRFARVRRVQAGDDFEAAFASPEDVIVKKMDFYRRGGSEKHLRDIMGVLKISRDQIDLAYIDVWARRLDLSDIWAVIQQRLAPDA